MFRLAVFELANISIYFPSVVISIRVQSKWERSPFHRRIVWIRWVYWCWYFLQWNWLYSVNTEWIYVWKHVPYIHIYVNVCNYTRICTKAVAWKHKYFMQYVNGMFFSDSIVKNVFLIFQDETCLKEAGLLAWEHFKLLFTLKLIPAMSPGSFERHSSFKQESFNIFIKNNLPRWCCSFVSLINEKCLRLHKSHCSWFQFLPMYSRAVFSRLWVTKCFEILKRTITL